MVTVRSPGSHRCAQISCFRGSRQVTVCCSSSTQLLSPVVLSAFQPDIGLTLRSALGARFSRSSFLTNNVFVKMLLPPQYLHRANRMPCQSVPHMHKALSCVFIEEVYFCHKRQKKQSERFNACCLDEALHFKEDGCTKRSTQLCLLSVCLSFYFISIKCYLVLFLYYQLIVRSFH